MLAVAYSPLGVALSTGGWTWNVFTYTLHTLPLKYPQSRQE
jgi:hypothetical protein